MSTSPTILEAIGHPTLFGPHFSGALLLVKMGRQPMRISDETLRRFGATRTLPVLR
jgi:hypothetical protein